MRRHRDAGQKGAKEGMDANHIGDEGAGEEEDYHGGHDSLARRGGFEGRVAKPAAMTPLPGAADSRAAWPSQRGTRGFIQKSITATNSRTRTMVRTAGAKPPA